ncbi:MAG TPA: hypothetical protein VGK67_04660 [Myxococcales bacterium]|jgi:hypothetical protein
MPLDRVALPSELSLPPAPPDGPWRAEETTPRLMFVSAGSATYDEWLPGHRPVQGALPFAGPLVYGPASGDALLAARYPLKTDEHLLLTLGTRSSPDDAYSWQELEAVSSALPDFGLVEAASGPVAIVAGYRYGLQWTDAKTGKLLERLCSTGKTAQGKCAEDWYLGPVAQLSPGRIWAFHGVREAQADRRFAFEEIDVASRKVLRGIPAPDLMPFIGPGDFRTGAFSDGKTIWAAGSNLDLAGCIAVAAVGEPAPAVTSFCLQRAKATATQADRVGRFFAAANATGLDLYTPTGDLAFSLGIRGHDGFALSRDGRFACSAEACQSLRCIVGSAARPIEDAACAGLRREGFELDEEFVAGGALRR